MESSGDLKSGLENFLNSLLSSLPATGAQGLKGELEEKLFSLCRLDGPGDEERVKIALQHTHQVAEAMEIMTCRADWSRLSAGELFKHLVREVEEELPHALPQEKERKFEEYLSPVRDAAHTLSPYEITLSYLHDVGKLRARREHEFESAAIIANEGFFKQMGVPEDDAIVMEAAIKYHLILPSIFTGSYSLLSFLPVKEDSLLKKIEERGLTSRFLDALYLISVADVAGLGKMTRIKIDNFDLRAPLRSAFELNGTAFEKRLYELDRERVMTRLASLRCFNKMELKHEDLARFMGYVEEARGALLAMDSFAVGPQEWEGFLDFLPRLASFGYSIGLLYSFGATGDDGIPGSQRKISPRLLGLLVALSRLMRHKEEEQGWGNPLWEVSILNHPGFWDDAFKKLMAWMVKDASLDELLSPERVSYRGNEEMRVLAVDCRGLPALRGVAEH